MRAHQFQYPRDHLLWQPCGEITTTGDGILARYIGHARVVDVVVLLVVVLRIARLLEIAARSEVLEQAHDAAAPVAVWKSVSIACAALNLKDRIYEIKM